MFSSPIRVNLHQFGNCFYPIAITSSTNSNPSDYGHTHLQKSLDKFSWGRRGFHNKKTNCCVREGSFTVTVKNMCLWVQCCYSCHAPDIFGLGGNCSSLFIFLSHHSSILIFFCFSLSSKRHYFLCDLSFSFFFTLSLVLAPYLSLCPLHNVNLLLLQDCHWFYIPDWRLSDDFPGSHWTSETLGCIQETCWNTVNHCIVL